MVPENRVSFKEACGKGGGKTVDVSSVSGYYLCSAPLVWSHGGGGGEVNHGSEAA